MRLHAELKLLWAGKENTSMFAHWVFLVFKVERDNQEPLLNVHLILGALIWCRSL
jgi:hypothetical protein